MLELDADLANADWTKRSWDLPADTPAALRAVLASHGVTVEEFKRLPVYAENKGRLAWLAEL